MLNNTTKMIPATDIVEAADELEDLRKRCVKATISPIGFRRPVHEFIVERLDSVIDKLTGAIEP